MRLRVSILAGPMMLLAASSVGPTGCSAERARGSDSGGGAGGIAGASASGGASATGGVSQTGGTTSTGGVSGAGASSGLDAGGDTEDGPPPAPLKTASFPGVPRDIAVDDAAVYVTTEAGLTKVAKLGGEKTVLVQGVCEHGLALHGNKAFAVCNDGIVEVPGAKVVVAEKATALAAGVDGVYWAFDGAIKKLVASSGSTSTLVTGLSPVVALGVDAGKIYFVDATRVASVPLTGGAVTTLAVLPKTPGHGLVVDSGMLYFGAGSSIWRVPTAGGTPLQIVNSDADSFAVDATTLYYFEYEMGAGVTFVKKAPKAGGTSTIALVASCGHLVSGDDYVWLAAGCTWDKETTLWALPKEG